MDNRFNYDVMILLIIEKLIFKSKEFTYKPTPALSSCNKRPAYTSGQTDNPCLVSIGPGYAGRYNKTLNLKFKGNLI